MARDVRVKIKLRGLNGLMSSQPAMSEVMRAGHKTKRDSGVDGLEVVASPHPWTAGAIVRAQDGKRLSDAEVVALLGAIAAGR